MEEQTQNIIKTPQYRTEAAEYQLSLGSWGEIISRIVFELYETRELNKRVEPLYRKYIPKSELLGDARRLLIETEAGVTALRGEKAFGKNRRRVILGELTLTEEDELVFKMNAINDLNLDPQGIREIVEDTRYHL